MKKVSLDQLEPYKAPQHFDFAGLKLHGKEETGVQKFRIGLSYFLPGGGTEYLGEDSPQDRVVFVLEGQVTIKTKKEEVTLGPMDSVYLAPNEGREIINRTKKPASMLVITSY
ncbi:cupin domain-containing protein [Chloroflexota bacterium]